MLRNAAVDIIASRLGKRTDLRDEIISEMDLIIGTELEKTGTYYIWQLSAFTSASLAAGASSLSLSGIIAFHEETPLYRSIPGDAVLAKLHYSDAIVPVGDPSLSPTGFPEAWTWDGVDQISFDKVTDQIYNIWYRAYMAASSIAGLYSDSGTNLENSWLKYAPDLVIGATGERMAINLRAPELAQMFNAQKMAAVARCYTEDIARREAMADRATTDD